ncbi:MAG: enoyl-CoA hydratase [Methyloligellaceae bacterium]
MTPANAANNSSANVDADVLLREFQDGICTLTLNRPGQRNALSLNLINALIRELDDIAQDTAIRVVILAGAGPVFSSGHDLREIRDNPSEQFYRQLFDNCSSLMMKIITLPQPVIARVHGPASAAGCQLVATCDLAVATNTATFATPGVNIGLFCSTPMVALSRNVGRKHAMRMLLSGEPVSATRAQEMGLVSDVTEEENLDVACVELARLIASKSRQAVKIGKEAFYRQLELGIKEAYEFAGDVMTVNMSKEDAAEGIGAFLDKRDPQWKE